MQKNRKGVSLKVGNNFYQEYCLEDFEGFSRVLFFHLNNRNNEGDGE